MAKKKLVGNESTQFKKGQIANPNGRPKHSKNIFSRRSAEKLSRMGADPLEFLGGIMLDENESKADRQRAAESILAFAYSKQPVISESKIEGAIPVMNVTAIDFPMPEGLVEDAEEFIGEE
jgi:hypothetical protein